MIFKSKPNEVVKNIPLTQWSFLRVYIDDSNYYLRKKRVIYKNGIRQREIGIFVKEPRPMIIVLDPEGKFRVKFSEKLIQTQSLAPMMINLFDVRSEYKKPAI